MDIKERTEQIKRERIEQIKLRRRIELGELLRDVIDYDEGIDLGGIPFLIRERERLKEPIRYSVKEDKDEPCGYGK